METIVGAAYIDVRARLTNFNNELKTGIKTSLAESEAAFAAGGRGLNTAAADMEAGLRGRLSGFAQKTGLSELKNEVGKATSALGVSLKIALPAAAAVATVEFTKMAGHFQSQMQLLVSAAGESQSAIKGMGDAVLATARLTGTSTDQLTSGLYNLEKAGYRGADATNVLKIAAEGARAEGAQLGTVVMGLTSVMASYHIPASQSANAMNEIIAAAGESKTSMENFSGALSTVIPIASAAHIQFSEVAGAVATLTQHGTSAAEATQELSSLIRSLQSPSQVASNAMQQMGINVTKFQQGLSNPKIGLIGSINTLVNTITAHMGPAGLVLVNSMKQSQSAGTDLQTMLKNMPASLRTSSQEFLNGTLSLTDFRKQFRGMGAEGAAQGAQFVALASKAKGFNDLLKSGSPAAQTFVQALKAVSGGAIGLNTMLQLTGGSMAGFEERTAKVAAAATKGGQNIATWGSVQKSFNVVMSQLGETVKTGAIQLGEKLLPAVSSAAGATAHWFQGLGSGGSIFANLQQKFGPFAGVVNFLHTAFTGLVSFVQTSLIPAAGNVIRALAPVFIAIEHGAQDVLHFGNDALTFLAHVFNDVLGPAIVGASHWFQEHGAVIAHDIIVVGQFALVLGGIGVAIRLYEAAVVQAAIVTGAFGNAMATLSLITAAFASRQEMIAFMEMLRVGTIATTIAIGAQAVVEGVVAAATKVWAGAQAVLAAVMEGTAISTVVEGAVGLLAAIPGIIAGIGAWTAAQIGLDVALDANPIGVLVLGIAALIAIVVAVVEAILHWQDVLAGLKGLLGTVGAVIQDIIGIAKGLLTTLEGIFTLNPHKLADGLKDIGKSLIGIPIDAVEGIGKSIGHLFGMGNNKTFSTHLDTGQLTDAATQASQQITLLHQSFDGMNAQLGGDTFAKFGTDVGSATDALQKQIGPLTQLDSLTKGHKTTIDGVKVTQKQWDQALKDTNGDHTRAAAMLVGLKPQLAAYQNQIGTLQSQQKTYNDVISTTSTNLHLSGDDVQKYAALMDISGAAVGKGAVSQQQFQSLVGQAGIALSNSTGAMHSFIDGLATYNNSARTATDQTNLFQLALAALSGGSTDVNVAIAQANQTIDSLASSVAGALDPTKSFAGQLGNAAKGTISLHGAGGQLTIGLAQTKTSIENAANAVFQNEIKTKSATVATQDAINKYDTLANSSLAQLQSKLHLSSGQFATLSSQIKLTPSEKKILLSMFGLTTSTTGMQTLLDKIAALKDKTVTVTVQQSIAQGFGSKLADPRLNFPRNGMVIPTVRYAQGGMENHVAQIATPTWRIWSEPETGGEAYLPLGSAKRTRSMALLAQVAKLFGGTFLPGVKLAGYANGGMSFASGGTYNGHTYSTSTALHNAQTANARLKVTIDASDIPKFIRSLTGSAAGISGAETVLANAASRASGGNRGLAYYLSHETTALMHLVSTRTTLAARLKTANANLVKVQTDYADESSRVSSNIMSSFDVSSAGNFNGYSTVNTIISALTTQAAQVSQFTTGLAALRAHGLNTTLLQQLGEAGVATAGANVATLASASTGQIAQINELFTQTQKSAVGSGNTIAGAMYQSGINAAKGLVNGLNSQIASINRTMSKVAASMVAVIKRDLGIHSPSAVFHGLGTNIGQGLVNGIAGHAQHVRNAAAMLGNVARAGVAASGGSTGGSASVTIQNNVYASPGMSTASLAARVSDAQAKNIQYRSAVPVYSSAVGSS